MHKSYHSEYYQAKIQVRPADQRLVDFIEDKINKNGKVWISRKVKLKTGIDYYISSNKFARQLGKQMKKKFEGKLKESVKLFSRDRQSGKNVYRATVCFRLTKDL